MINSVVVAVSYVFWVWFKCLVVTRVWFNLCYLF